MALLLSLRKNIPSQFCPHPIEEKMRLFPETEQRGKIIEIVRFYFIASMVIYQPNLWAHRLRKGDGLSGFLKNLLKQKISAGIR